MIKVTKIVSKQLPLNENSKQFIKKIFIDLTGVMLERVTIE